MKSGHIVFSKGGGAGAAAANLVAAMNAAGSESELIYITERSLWDEPFADFGSTVSASLDKWVISRDPHEGEISVLRSKLLGRRLSKIDLAGYTSLFVHWFPGAIDFLDLIPKHVKVFVWLHDMKSLTGACHQSMDCKGYTTGCRECPLVKRAYQGVVSRSLSKAELQASRRKVTWICPTDWMAGRARASTVARLGEIVTIPNIVAFTQTNMASEMADIPSAEILVVGSTSPSNYKKIEGSLLSQLQFLGKTTTVSLIGNFPEIDGIDSAGVVNRSSLQARYLQACLVVVPSKHESFSLVTAEALMLGKPVACYRETAPWELATKYAGAYDIELIQDFDKSRLPSPNREGIRRDLAAASIVTKVLDLLTEN